MPPVRPEVLAPAGGPDALTAALRAGADAVYFGLQGHNARARAHNFEAAELPGVLALLHKHGVKGYVTLNTLVFEDELSSVEAALRACAQAGVDAIIVQDLGVVQLAQAIAPTLPVHASTQMTCTDAGSVRFASDLGCSRVVVARELSAADIAAIRAAVDVELEVFVHGALCVSYSGQCLTSEAIGGRSANRGACAQACRLPYDLVVDGVVHDLGERAYLLSPQDLEASAVVADLAQSGVSSLKIEGRLKGPAYVTAATRLYRHAVDSLDDAGAVDSAARAALQQDALLTFSRGSGTGFLAGTDHQRLVEGKTCEHRGVEVGTVLGVVSERTRQWLRLQLTTPLVRGQGLLIEGGKGSRGEVGGRVWDVNDDENDGSTWVWLGPDVDLDDVRSDRRVFVNDDPHVEKRLLHEAERAPYAEQLHVTITGAVGEAFTLEATSVRGLSARVVGDAVVGTSPTGNAATLRAALHDKLSRLGETPYALATLTVQLPDDAALPPSSLNRARRALVDALQQSAVRVHAENAVSAAAVADAVVETALAHKTPPPPGLFVLCRTEAQAVAAVEAGADGVYLDFLALTGASLALEKLRARGAFVGLAPPRIRKPGEEKIDRFLAQQNPDALLVRGLGALGESGASGESTTTRTPLRVGDFSLNVTNRLSAATVLRHADAFTPSFDLDATQLMGLLSQRAGAHALAAYAELVVHHPMPLFHTEHCVFAALLSEGRDYKSCGRPCERHVIALRDRAGVDNPVEADVGCRNTVFHAQAQSAAAQVKQAQELGCGRFRVELVRESAADTAQIVAAYRALLQGQKRPKDIYSALRTEAGYGVVRGSLRVLTA